MSMNLQGRSALHALPIKVIDPNTVLTIPRRTQQASWGGHSNQKIPQMLFCSQHHTPPGCHSWVAKIDHGFVAGAARLKVSFRIFST